MQSGPCIAAIQQVRNCLCTRYAAPYPTVANSTFLLSPPLARPAVSWTLSALQLNHHSRFSNFQTYGITHELESSGSTTCEEPDDSLPSDQPLSTRTDANATTTNPKRRTKQRMRLDEYCLLLAPQYSRNIIQSFILQGKVRGRQVTPHIPLAYLNQSVACKLRSIKNVTDHHLTTAPMCPCAHVLLTGPAYHWHAPPSQ